MTVFGKPKFDKLIQFQAELPKVQAYGYLTKTILSGSMSANGSKLQKELIFFYLNKRPIDMPRKFKSLFTEIYR